MLKVLVVDDEPLARRRLIRMLGRIGDVEVIGEADNGEEALRHLREHPCDLLLLDIDMPRMDGLELAEQPRLPAIVFTTAHAEHALRAFEVAAADYLLKPISQTRLAESIERVRAARGLTSTGVVPLRITAREGSTVHIVDVREVDRFHASHKCSVFWHRGRELLLDDSLNTLEQRLAPLGFFRSHRAELIRVEAVVALEVEGGQVRARMRDGSTAAVGRRTLAELKRRLGIG